MQPVGVAPAPAVNQSGEELQPHGTGLEFGNGSRCCHVGNKEDYGSDKTGHMGQSNLIKDCCLLS